MMNLYDVAVFNKQNTLKRGDRVVYHLGSSMFSFNNLFTTYNNLRPSNVQSRVLKL